MTVNGQCTANNTIHIVYTPSDDHYHFVPITMTIHIGDSVCWDWRGPAFHAIEQTSGPDCTGCYNLGDGSKIVGYGDQNWENGVLLPAYNYVSGPFNHATGAEGYHWRDIYNNYLHGGPLDVLGPVTNTPTIAPTHAGETNAPTTNTPTLVPTTNAPTHAVCTSCVCGTSGICINAEGHCAGICDVVGFEYCDELAPSPHVHPPTCLPTSKSPTDLPTSKSPTSKSPTDLPTSKSPTIAHIHVPCTNCIGESAGMCINAEGYCGDVCGPGYHYCHEIAPSPHVPPPTALPTSKSPTDLPTSKSPTIAHIHVPCTNCIGGSAGMCINAEGYCGDTCGSGFYYCYEIVPVTSTSTTTSTTSTNTSTATSVTSTSITSITSTNTIVPEKGQQPEKKKKSSMSAGDIAGIVIGTICVAGLVGIVVYKKMVGTSKNKQYHELEKSESFEKFI